MAAAVVVVVAAGGSAAWWTWGRGSDASAAAQETVASASLGSVQQTVTASGTVEPARQAALSFTVSGTVTSVPVQVGDVVTAGQTLATVDPTALQADVQTAQASLTAALASLTAQQDAGADSTQLASAQAQVASAQSKLTQAQAARAAATLTSTIGGTVAAVGYAVGDRVGGSTGGSAASASSGAAGGAGSSASSSASITVISTDAYVVDAGISSADVARVKKGLQAQITPSGSTTRVFGTVSSVGVVASSTTTTGQTATFPVTIAITGTPSGLYAGATADVSIVVSQAQGVLTVPTLALRTTTAGTVVTRRVAGKDVTTPVTLGTTYGATTQVLKGLAAGDQVVLPVTRPGGTAGTGTRTRTGTGGFGGGGFGGGGFGGGGFGGGTGGAAPGGAP